VSVFKILEQPASSDLNTDPHEGGLPLPHGTMSIRPATLVRFARQARRLSPAELLPAVTDRAGQAVGQAAPSANTASGRSALAGSLAGDGFAGANITRKATPGPAAENDPRPGMTPARTGRKVHPSAARGADALLAWRERREHRKHMTTNTPPTSREHAR
jgi:hypothetical protein